MIGLRHKGKTPQQYEGTCKRFVKWIRTCNIPCAWLYTATPTTLAARQDFASRLDNLFMQWSVYLVEIQQTVQSHSAQQYIVHVRSRIDDAVGFSTAKASPINSLLKTISGLTRIHPIKRRRRDPMVQQHLIAWEKVLDCSKHQHRLALTIATVSVMTASRFSDFGPRTQALYDPTQDCSQADVVFERRCGFLRFPEHKTSNKGKWAPKVMPQPKVAFPFMIGNVSVNSWWELLHFTGHGIPHHISLSAYFQVRRLLMLQAPETTPPGQRPLFQLASGEAADYGWYYKTICDLSNATGFKFISPHSGRKGGIVAANATGLASGHDLQMLGNMAQSSTTLIYDETTVTHSSAIVLAMTDAPRTETMSNRGFGGSQFVNPSAGAPCRRHG